MKTPKFEQYSHLPIFIDHTKWDIQNTVSTTSSTDPDFLLSPSSPYYTSQAITYSLPKYENSSDLVENTMTASQMGESVLGFYNPSSGGRRSVNFRTHYANWDQQRFVRPHEYFHARNIHPEARPFNKIEEDEANADANADAHIGGKYSRQFYKPQWLLT